MNLSLAQHNLALENTQTIKTSPRNAAATLSALAALAAFEVFNFSTASMALQSLFGNLAMGGIKWASLFALAICCMDIAGIICLFLPAMNPTHGRRDYRLFGAWLLASGLNTWLTWHGINLAITIRQAQIGGIVDTAVLTGTLPGFMALLIWVIRILIIGSLSHPKSVSLAQDYDLEESQRSHEEARVQVDPFVDLMPHEGTYPFNPVTQPTRNNIINRDPTYRGIPVRYKTS
jgi:hypothetical protein